MLVSFLTDAMVVAVVLGVMIFVHELGHFLAAKWFGVRVLTFSLGFGKRLLGWKRGDTDYRVSALPLGGYVKMAGDDPSEVRPGEPGEFLEKPRWQRFFIVIMGPAMNVLLAILLLTGLYKVHSPKLAFLEQPAQIGDIEPDSPAAKAGLQPGDLIVRLGNLRNPRWEDAEIKVVVAVGEAIPIEILREGATVATTLTPRAEGRDRAGYVGWYPVERSTIAEVQPGFPAEKAGLKVGDQIVEIDGRRAFCGFRLSQIVQSVGGRSLNLVILRNGKELSVELTPVYRETKGEKRWLIGVLPHSDVVIQKLRWREALASSLRDNVRNVLVTFDVLGRIVTRRMSARSLSGPIGIAQMSGEAYRAGFPELFMLVAFISLQLGVFNLLPIPILDGGVILLLLIESGMRRDLSLQVKERFVQVGIVFLLLLAGFVMFNDIVKTFRPN